MGTERERTSRTPAGEDAQADEMHYADHGVAGGFPHPASECACRVCGLPVVPLTMTCSRECALVYWRSKKSINVVDIGGSNIDGINVSTHIGGST